MNNNKFFSKNTTYQNLSGIDNTMFNEILKTLMHMLGR